MTGEKSGESSETSLRITPSSEDAKDLHARKQAKQDERIVFDVSEGMSKVREPLHIRSEVPSDSLHMGNERFEAAVAALGIEASNRKRSFFKV